MPAPVLLLIYGNLFKVNRTFPLCPSARMPELCLPWLRGCLDWGFCLTVSASRSMTFESGGGKYCRGSKESVEKDLLRPRLQAGRWESCSAGGSATRLPTKKNLPLWTRTVVYLLESLKFHSGSTLSNGT